MQNIRFRFFQMHILIVHLDIWHSLYAESVVAFFNYFVVELVSNLTNYSGQAAGLVGFKLAG